MGKPEREDRPSVPRPAEAPEDQARREPGEAAADETGAPGALISEGGAPEAAARGAGVGGAESPASGEQDPEVLRDRWLRAEADLQNYRRRAVREREEARRAAEEGVMLEVIAALDDLDRALALAREAGAADAWAEGVRMVAARLTDYLVRQGVVETEAVGQPFDPALHEAVLEMDVPGAEPGSVTQVIRKGWCRGARPLRAARVVVARTPAGDA